jgi:Fe-S-cluster containining protein
LIASANKNRGARKNKTSKTQNATFFLFRQPALFMNETLLLTKVAQLYRELDRQISQWHTCRACGRCCDFDTFGHRLYLTPPELLYFAHHAGRPLKPMTEGICPYRVEGRCSVYPYRFVGCRIFQCNGSEAAQSDLTEAALKRLKQCCTRHHIPYRYMDLKTALNSL